MTRASIVTVGLPDRYRTILADVSPTLNTGLVVVHLDATDALTSGRESVRVPDDANVLLQWGVDKGHYRAVELAMPALRWVHVPWVGVDWLITQRVESGVVKLTNSPGTASRPVAEYVVACILADLKQLDQHADNHTSRRWMKLQSAEMPERRLLIVGFGSIGHMTARFAAALGMRVRSVTRTPIADPACEWVGPMHTLHAELAEADYVLVTLPATSQTVGCFNASAFAAMKPDACLINVGRGEVIDEEALSLALMGGQIRRAYLDVVRQEPLEAANPLWSVDGLLVTSHSASWTRQRFDRSFERFTSYLTNFIRDEAPFD